MTTLILSATAARSVTVSNTTLFEIAARELGDARQWTRIAKLNGIVDPWISDLTTLKLPPIDRAGQFDGVSGL